MAWRGFKVLQGTQVGGGCRHSSSETAWRTNGYDQQVLSYVISPDVLPLYLDSWLLPNLMKHPYDSVLFLYWSLVLTLLVLILVLRCRTLAWYL